MNKLYLLANKLGWLVLLVALAGCALSSTPGMPTAPPATQMPGVTQIPPPATYTPSPTLQAQAAAPLPTSAPPTPSPTITPTPLVPPCTFEANSASQASASSLNDYVFSEPQVVLTHTSAIDVADWLPDGQRLLISRRFPGQSREYVEVFNPQTGELQQYGERTTFNIGFNPKPFWLDPEQAVAFTDFDDAGFVLYIKRDQENSKVLSGLTSPYPAPSPDGRQVIFLPKALNGQPEILDVTQARQTTLALSLPTTFRQDSSAVEQMSRLEPYKAIWHPDRSSIAFYNNIGFYLVDPTTEKACEVDLGTYGPNKLWAIDAKWSPNGRYLAALITVGEPVVPFNLILIDINTGQQRQIDIGHPYLYTIAWADNGRDLLAGAEIGQDQGTSLYGLYLVDAVTGDSRQMLADHQSIGDVFWGVAWSSTRQEIALACPILDPTDSTMVRGHLCFIAVEAGP